MSNYVSFSSPFPYKEIVGFLGPRSLQSKTFQSRLSPLPAPTSYASNKPSTVSNG